MEFLAVCLVVNKSLSRVDCPFQWLGESNGETGLVMEARALTTRSVHGLDSGVPPTSNGGGERVGG